MQRSLISCCQVEKITMKKKLFLIVFCTGILFFSCSKNSNNIAEKPSLTGKWDLVEVLKDPDSDYVGKWQTADTTEHLYLTFKTDSSIEKNTGFGIDDLVKYHVLNDSVIVFRNNIPVEHNYGHDYFENGRYYHEEGRYYQLNNSCLIIKGGCYQACGWKFIRSKKP